MNARICVFKSVNFGNYRAYVYDSSTMKVIFKTFNASFDEDGQVKEAKDWCDENGYTVIKVDYYS